MAPTVGAARKEPLQITAKMARGENPTPRSMSHESRARGITLQAVWDEYKVMLHANGSAGLDRQGRFRTERDYEYAGTH